jgi:ribosomal protein S6--L-glutamate ligase
MVDAWRALDVEAFVIAPSDAERVLRASDAALFRLDVLPGLDGVEPGLGVATALEASGVRILNHPESLLATHDKLETAHVLEEAEIPHPRTWHLTGASAPPDLTFPCVLKPRFGSWGQDVHLCPTSDDLVPALRAISERSWWIRHGALAQELVGPVAHDLRIIVAGSTVVAAARRTAAPGEWRTNVSLGGRVGPADIDDDARRLAIRAAHAIGIDLVGVDLLPHQGSWIVLELNGAVDFDRGYALRGVDPYAAILDALALGDADRRYAPTTRREATMAKTVKGKMPRPGDEIVITGHSVGDAPRTALILEVLGEPGHERFHVRWEDGHESIYFPADDATVHRRSRKGAATA